MSLRSHLPLFALALFTLAGCGSSEEATPITDSGTGADAVVDTGKPSTDSATDTGSAAVACEEPVPADFACAEPVKGTGATTCTEAMLQDFVANCLADDLSVPSTCAAWKTANAACASCVANWSWSEIPGSVYPDDYKCYWGIMDASCAKATNCSFDCQAATCGSCDDTEQGACLDSVTGEGGKCWDVASKTAEGCFEKYDLANCNVDEIYSAAPDLTKMRAEILRFYRGACRDNANWTNSNSAGDAGVSDSGATETGGSDGGTDATTTETSVSDAADAD